MKLVDLVKENCIFLGKMAYDSTRFGWRWTEGGGDVPRYRGIYFLISRYGIEKVGSARGRYGIRQRLLNYTGKYGQMRKRDPTVELWNAAMSSQLLDEQISLYCMEVPDDEPRKIDTILGSFTVSTNVTLNVEAHFFKLAVEEKEPMRLCGSSP